MISSVDGLETQKETLDMQARMIGETNLLLNQLIMTMERHKMEEKEQELQAAEMQKRRRARIGIRSDIWNIED